MVSRLWIRTDWIGLVRAVPPPRPPPHIITLGVCGPTRKAVAGSRTGSERGIKLWTTDRHRRDVWRPCRPQHRRTPHPTRRLSRRLALALPCPPPPPAPARRQLWWQCRAARSSWADEPRAGLATIRAPRGGGAADSRVEGVALTPGAERAALAGGLSLAAPVPLPPALLAALDTVRLVLQHTEVRVQH
eukprot:1186870-Prorocentrum_minimum.AAC.2